VDAVAAASLHGRYDLARAQKELENISTSVDFFNDQKLPDVRLETSYRGSGLGGTRFIRDGGFPGSIVGTSRKGYSGVLGQMFDHTYPSWSVGLTVSYSLGRSYEEAGLARAGRAASGDQRFPSLRPQIAETLGRPRQYTAPPSASKPLARASVARSASTSSSGDMRLGSRRAFS
jgi:hypothetical protein